MMLKNYLNYFLAALLLFGPIAPTAMAKTKGGQKPSTDEIKIKVAKLGTGAKAKATVWLADGRKVKGYISQAGDDDFVMRDRKTAAPTTVRYADVVKLDRNNGHSTAKWVAIGASVGVGAFVLILLAYIAHID
jgi:hypothetical protein